MNKLSIELPEIVYESGCLKQVEYITHLLIPESPESIIFTFEDKIFTASCLDEDDTIELTHGQPEIDINYKIVLVSDAIPWLRVINTRLLWAWSLTNQQGYRDGLRFEFVNSSSKENIIIELIAIASVLKIYQSLKV